MTKDDGQDDFNERRACVGDRPPDQLRSVVDRYHPDAAEACRARFPSACLNLVDHIQRVAPLAHDHDARYHFAGPIQVGGATTYIRTQHNLSDVFDADRCAILIRKNNLLDVTRRLHISAPADHVFGAAKFEQSRARLVVPAAHRLNHSGNRNPVRTQAIGIHVDLVLLA